MLCHGTSCLTLFTHVTWTCLINLCKPGQAALAACMRRALATCPNVMNAPRVAAAAFCRLLLYALARNFVCYGNNLRQQCQRLNTTSAACSCENLCIFGCEDLPSWPAPVATPFARQFPPQNGVLWHIYISILLPAPPFPPPPRLAWLRDKSRLSLATSL